MESTKEFIHTLFIAGSSGERCVQKGVYAQGMYKMKCPYVWNGLQSYKQNIPEGNMAISAGILLSGMIYSFRRAMEITGVLCISERRFYEIRRRICSAT